MSVNNLSQAEAQDKLKELATSIDFCMMATALGEKPLHVIPMSTKKVENTTIWFLSGKDSEHNTHIQSDSDVQLIYSQPKNFEFLNLYGKASIVTEQKVLESLYQESDDAWFDGVNDPNLSAIKFEVEHAYYWDTKHNKFVSMLQIAKSAITGEKAELGVKGELNV